MTVNSLFLVAALAFTGLTGCSKDDDNNGGTTTLAAKTELNVSYGTDPLQKIDIYLPEGRTEANTKALVLIHGGAWIAGDKSDFTPLVDTMKKYLPDYAIFNLNYRLATLSGSNAWPTQINDVNTAMNSLLNNGSNYQVNMNKMVIIGASAGAHLGLIRAYNFNTNNHVKAMVNFFGPSDMSDLYNFYSGTNNQALLQLFVGGTPASNPASYTSASPLTMINAGDPPTITFHGTADATVPVRQSDSLHVRLQRAGIVSQYYKYQGLGHGDVTWATTFPETYARSVAFIRQYNP